MRTPVFGVRTAHATRAICEPLRRRTAIATASLRRACERYARMRSQSPFAAAVAHKSDASRTPCGR
eukprot:6426642-Lingulodinium_polyedra.AAC.1